MGAKSGQRAAWLHFGASGEKSGPWKFGGWLEPGEGVSKTIHPSANKGGERGRGHAESRSSLGDGSVEAVRVTRIHAKILLRKISASGDCKIVYISRCREGDAENSGEAMIRPPHAWSDDFEGRCAQRLS
jgi:hypothetical protein